LDTNHEPGGIWKDVALVILVLIYSGNPSLTLEFPSEPQLVLLSLFLFFLLIRKSRTPFSSDFVLIASIFAIILLVQCIEFAFYPFVTLAGFFIRLFIGYAFMRLVDDFPLAFVRAMLIIAIASLIFHIPFLLFSSLGFSLETTINQAAELLGTAGNRLRIPLFLHTFVMDYFPPRNAGMFWEPGAFAGYLILSLAFLALIKNEIAKNDYKKYFIIFSTALLTTLSTAGYIVFPFVMLLHYKWGAVSMRKSIERGLLACFVVVPLIMLVSMYSYNKFEFLWEKVEIQFRTVEYRDYNWHRTRFGSLVFDLEYIKQRPLFGWGLHENTRLALHPEFAENPQGMGNGLSSFTAKFGIIGMMTWLGATSLGLMRLTPGSRFKPIYMVLILILLLQGEQFLNYPFWLGLAFLKTSQNTQRGCQTNMKPVKKRISIRW